MVDYLLKEICYLNSKTKISYLKFWVEDTTKLESKPDTSILDLIPFLVLILGPILGLIFGGFPGLISGFILGLITSLIMNKFFY